jgi:hypothetical protein
MPGYAFIAADLKKLYNTQFQVYDIGLNKAVDFVIPDEARARERQGAEGYGILVECHHPIRGLLRSFMKILRVDVAERRERTEFLIRLGLAGSHAWMFQGVPYAWLAELSIGGVPIVGHVALEVGGQFGGSAEDFRVLKVQDMWDHRFTLEQRKLFAGQLCCAVAAMDQISFVHGDLSAANVMIGPGPAGATVCCLCDFDGFFSPKVKLLPRVFGNQDLRPLGTAGYQYPDLLARISQERQAHRKDLGLVVQSDRFALAALVCELVLWNPDLGARLGRDELLSTDDIEARSVSAIAPEVINTWPEGFMLLDRALKANGVEDMPSPEDWLTLLGVNVFPHKPFTFSPFLNVFRRSGKTRTPYKGVQIVNNKSGDLGRINDELAPIQYRIVNGLLYVDFQWQKPVFMSRGGRRTTLTGPTELEVSPGDCISSNFWEFEFHNGTPTA